MELQGLRQRPPRGDLAAARDARAAGREHTRRVERSRRGGRGLPQGPLLWTWLGAKHERGAVAPQPVTVGAVVGPVALQERPEAGRVVEHEQVADLVPDDVVEHAL